MEGEIWNFVVDWTIALASIMYCYIVGKFIPQGTTRFLALFPLLPLFFYLPLNLTTMFLCGLTFFFMTWLATFKITLFAFSQGPLASNPPLSCSQFIIAACLPIKILKTSSRIQENSKRTRKSAKDYVTKVSIFLIMIKAHGYKDFVHPLFATLIYIFIIFFMLELCLSLAAIVAQAAVGFELEPQFDEPQKATSVQNFWGKRWNLIVSSILRPMVYIPSRRIFGHVMPQKWVSVPAVFVTFVVSGIMHELIFYYLGRFHPTWEVTSFFVVNGLWVGLEIIIKKTIGQRFKLPSAIASVLTLGFVILTCSWLFFPPFLRFNPFIRSWREVMAVVEFFKDGHI
ncbi:hypothetical protein R6Q59_027256 [Mikania micrantha]|uniref:Wax synthase domain-containing protein n=1 Tax=Mikania micrantha TaxID=192012 RepID=A0A5N6MBF6_9ASTR|nr:hypothetical protein E3N88_33496 [Mikania micrantha]